MVVHSTYPFDETRVQRETDALINKGIEVDIICLRFKNEPSIENVNGAKVYRLPLHRRKGIGIIAQLLEYLTFFVLAFVRLTYLHLRHRYDTIQVHNLPDFLVFITLIPKVMGTPVILDLHDLMPEFYQARFFDSPSSWRSRLIRWQEKISCRFADHVITVTEPWRKTLLERGVPSTKCTVVMNLADGQFFSPSPSTKASKKNNGHFHLIYHGTLAKRYGIDLALQAIVLVRREIPGVHLTIHGRGDYLETLRQLADELGLDGNVHFNDQFLSIDQLSKLIASADVGVVPYRRDVFTDGILPTKLMEYAALGIPAIVSRTPTISAYFDETMVEFFTAENVEELAQSIQMLYDDRTRLGELASNIQKFNQRYSWAAQKTGYVNLVKGLA